jgi:superfamily II DNA or RNA helicase
MLLRPYQLDALQKAKERYAAGVYRQLLVLPTGMGKTPTFAALRDFFGFRKRVLVLVHREELAQQAADKLRKWNPGSNVGIEMGDNRAGSDCDFIVGSVQTLGRAGSNRLAALQPEAFDAVIVDEAHHSTSPSYKEILFGHFQFGRYDTGRLLLGVTATPNRGDGVALGTVYDEIVYRYPLLDAIRNGWLCNLRGLRVRTGVELDGVHVRAGDFEMEELAEAVNTPARNEQIAREWLNNAAERKTLAFSVNVAHAKSLASAFQQYGVAAEAIWAEDPHRASKLRAHREGHLRVLTNCGILTEGYDDPALQAIVLARPTKSQLLFMQMAGRGTRLPEGIDNLNEARQKGVALAKEDCLLLDVTDNTVRHSLVTLASIFGLPAKLDLNKRTITEVVAKVEAATAGSPDVDLSLLEDLSKLESYVQEVDLFTVKFSQEIQEGSKLQWHKSPAGNYVLLLPKKERVVIAGNILDKWDITGTVCGTPINERDVAELSHALVWADSTVQLLGGKQLLSLLRRDTKAKWAADPITKDQIKTLKWKLQGRPWPDFAAMTKRDASVLLTKLFAQG